MRSSELDMPDVLPPEADIKLTQVTGSVTAAKIAKLAHVIVVMPHRTAAPMWKKLPEGSRLQQLARRLSAGKALSSHFGNANNTGVTLGRLPKIAGRETFSNTFVMLGFAGSLAARALENGPRTVGIVVIGLPVEHQVGVCRALTLALHAHAFRLPSWRSKADTKRPLARISLIGLAARLDLNRERIEANAINLARWLTQMPPNKLDATSYRKAIGRLARARAWKMQTLNESALRRLSAGAFLAVAQGNADNDAVIIRLQYRPKGSTNRPRVSLIGKGIVFDTGGNNVKTFKSMLDMHEDMAGSATALATLQALTDLGFPHAVDCWLAITENRIGAKAYKSRDVVSACNGKTIEVIHTDAEGRMALADTLALAGREKPALMIDYATLTGTCVHALTERYSGVFSNRAELNPLLIATGEHCGERVWPFPMDPDFEDDLKSQLADLLQCSVDGGGDHILAARFLRHFVPDEAHWIHMDLSAASRKGGLAQIPSGATGFGVRFTLNLLYEQSGPLSEALHDDSFAP